MKTFIQRRLYRISAFVLILSVAGHKTASQGIPEPSLILYGVIRNGSGNESVRRTEGTLTWQFESAAAGVRMTISTVLTNINDQFSYVLRVPCESVVGGFAPSPDTLQLSATATVYNRSQVLIDGVPATFAQPAQATTSLSSRDRGRIERIDLFVSSNSSDSDGDGLPDAWEQQYLGGLRHGADEDSDRDGLSNLNEYRTGTNPNDPNSRFAFIGIEGDPGSGVVIEWSSADGQRYVVQRSSDLLSGFATIASNVLATPPRNSYRDQTALGAGPYFYRLRLQE